MKRVLEFLASAVIVLVYLAFCALYALCGLFASRDEKSKL
jgi:hypothetical protein